MITEEEIHQIIEYSNESSDLDFKLEAYPFGKTDKKYDILKDFSSFCNHPIKKDKLIIIGIKKHDNGEITLNENLQHPDQALYQQFLNEYIEPEINFDYYKIKYKNSMIGVFRIFDSNNGPYLFKKNAKSYEFPGKVNHQTGIGYIRTGTSTRVMNRMDFINILSKPKKRDKSRDVHVDIITDEQCLYDRSNILVKVIDINIENLSNASLEVFPEVTIYKENDHLLMTKDYYFQLSQKAALKKSNVVTTGFDKIINRDREIKFTQNNTGKTATLINPESNINRIIKVEQGQKIYNVYGGKLMIAKGEEKLELRGKVVLRSDEFLSGPIEINFTHKYKEHDA